MIIIFSVISQFFLLKNYYYFVASLLSFLFYIKWIFHKNVCIYLVG